MVHGDGIYTGFLKKKPSQVFQKFHQHTVNEFGICRYRVHTVISFFSFFQAYILCLSRSRSVGFSSPSFCISTIPGTWPAATGIYKIEQLQVFKQFLLEYMNRSSVILYTAIITDNLLSFFLQGWSHLCIQSNRNCLGTLVSRLQN